MSNTKIKAGQFSGIVSNGTDGYFLMTNGDGTMAWEAASTGPSVTSVSYPGDDLAADPVGGQTVVLTGTNFGSSMTVSIGGTTAPSVAHDSSTQLTITTPAKAAGDYDIVVTNTVTGASGTFVNGISYNGVPTWTTATGSLGTFDSETTISTITLQATEPDGGTITFNITNGALPTGLSLTGANIDGTTIAESSTTLYSFTIEAIDDENQATPRNFSITVNSAAPIPSENFTPKLYSGGSAGQVITGVGFQPDLIITKRRDTTANWFVNDAARTGSLFITDGAEISYQYLTPNSDGFVVNGTGGVHNTGSLVAYCFKGGGSSNTFNVDGIGYSTASAAGLSASNATTMVGASVNTKAGFSVIRYNTNAGGASPANRPAHGLGVEPKLVIFRPITSTGLNWYTMHKLVDGSTDFVYLNLANAKTNAGNSEFINTTHFGTDFGSMWGNVIAYCFADVNNYQKIGTYTGTGTNLNTINVGFQPRFVLFKRTDSTGDWRVFDSIRGTDKSLRTSTDEAEYDDTQNYVDFTSSGFEFNRTLQQANPDINGSGGTYIYLAIA